MEGIRNRYLAYLPWKIGYKKGKELYLEAEPPRDASVQIKQDSIFYHAYFISE